MNISNRDRYINKSCSKKKCVWFDICFVKKKVDFGGVCLVKKVISIGSNLHDKLLKRRLS